MMNNRLARVLLRIAVVGLLVGGQFHFGFGNDAEKKKIEQLVNQLGSGRFAQREQASKELLSIGEKALPELQRAAQGDADIEVRERAKKLMPEILKSVAKSKSTKMEFAVIVEGKFQMGSPAAEVGRQKDEEARTVYLTKPYLIGKREVTQWEYIQVLNPKHNPSYHSPDGEGRLKVAGLDLDKYPVENVTWFDAIYFCNELSKLDGFEPFYKIEDIKKDGAHIIQASVTPLGTNGYRLPTEAEWEYACRGQTETRFHFGYLTKAGQLNCKPLSTGGYGGSLKWNDTGRTIETGSYPGNDHDLRDMHGNVGEWCWDWYDKDYGGAKDTKNPTGPGTGTHRVVKGGSFLVNENNCRTASRFYLKPDTRHYTVGFRVVRQP